MMNKRKVRGIIMFCVVFIMMPCFLLSACRPFELVCFTGLCPSVKERMAQIPWNPSALNYQNCPNISGKYQSRIYRGIGHLDLMNEFPQSDDTLGFIHVTLKTFCNIPAREIPIPTPTNLKKVRYDDSEFYNNAFVSVKQDDKELVVSLIHNSGKLYRQQTISLDSSMIGCADGYFIIRTLNPPGAGEWGYGWASAEESRFKKQADGSLEILYYKREWHYGDILGLIGMNPDGSENRGGPPREGRSTLIFRGAS